MTGSSAADVPEFRQKLHELIGSLQAVEESLSDCPDQRTGEGRRLSPESRQQLEQARQALNKLVGGTGNTAALRIENARLASFPEKNPNPILEVSLDGKINYTNPAARNLFPDLEERALRHPYLTSLDKVIEEADKGTVSDLRREVQVGEHFYLQSISWVEDKRYLRVYGIDITELKQTEEELNLSNDELNEQRAFLQAILQQLPIAVGVYDAHTGEQILRNQVREEIWRSPEAIVNSFTDFLKYQCLHADGSPYALEEMPVMRTIRARAPVRDEVMTIQRGDGTEGVIQVNSAPVFLDGEMVAAVNIIADITDLKNRQQELQKINRTLRAISNCNQAMMRAQTEDELMQAVCRIVVEDCGHVMAWAGYAEDDPGKTIRPVASAGFDQGYLEHLNLTWADTERGRGPGGTAIRTGKVCMCRDILHEPQFAPFRADAIKRGYSSSIVLPLLAAGRAFGELTLYSHAVDPFTPDEVTLLSELAGDLAYGITTLRLRAAQAESEAALKVSEERYRTLFNGMTEGFAVHEMVYDQNGLPADYRFLDINPAFENLTGLKREDVIGKLHYEILPGDDPRWLQEYARVANTGQPVHFENYSPALRQYYEVFAYRPAPDQFAVLFLNITARKQLEDELRQSERMYRAIGESIDYGVWVCDRNGRNIYASESFLKLVGQTQQECSDFGWGKVLHPDDAERTMAAWKECARMGGTWDIEHRYRGVDGRWHPILARGVPIRDEAGQIIQWVGINLDISRIKQAEEALQKAHDELETRVEERTQELGATNEELMVEITERQHAEQTILQNAARSETLAEVSSRLATTTLNEKAALEVVTEAASSSLGDACTAWLLSDDKKHLTPQAFYHRNPKSQAKAWKVLTTSPFSITEGIAGEVIRTGKARLLAQPLLSVLRKSMKLEFQPLLDSPGIASAIFAPLQMEGNSIGALVLVRDEKGQPYTEEDFQFFTSLADRASLAIANARLYQDLEKSLEQEQTLRGQLIQVEKNLALNRMVSSVAHEINNPIQTIVNCLYLIKGCIAEDAPEYEALTMAVSETRRIAGLVQQLRDIYRPGKDKTMRPLELQPVIEEVHRLLAPHLQHHGVTWEALDIPEGIRFNGIPDQIKQVFLNIGLNAVDAMDPEVGKITVRATVDASRGEVGVSLTDTGPGIDPEHLDQIFEPFFTTKNAGTGLGLAITFDIVQHHGGRITVASPPGRGATFTVWLPLCN